MALRYGPAYINQRGGEERNDAVGVLTCGGRKRVGWRGASREIISWRDFFNVIEEMRTVATNISEIIRRRRSNSLMGESGHLLAHLMAREYR